MEFGCSAIKSIQIAKRLYIFKQGSRISPW